VYCLLDLFPSAGIGFMPIPNGTLLTFPKRFGKIMTTIEKEFVNYYDVLEASPKANLETIERLFRHLAKRYHPDVAESGDVHKFSQIVEAYEVLRNPEARAEFDTELSGEVVEVAELEKEVESLNDDAADRHHLLSLLYAKRRKDMKRPGIGIGGLEEMVSYPYEVLEFHIWYFREKGWIMRLECGQWAITADGVDKIEATLENEAMINNKRIEVRGSDNGVINK
jgi:hypothetical protein